MKTSEVIEYLQRFGSDTEVQWLAVNIAQRKKYYGDVIGIIDIDNPVFIFKISEEADFNADEIKTAEECESEGEKHKSENTLELNGIVLRYKQAERFREIKNHMEQIREEYMSDEEAAWHLIDIGMTNYRFL